MQREPKTTKITVREDYPTSVSSSIYGANLDAIAFNMGLISRLNPSLAKQIIGLYERAHNLKGSSL